MSPRVDLSNQYALKLDRLCYSYYYSLLLKSTHRSLSLVRGRVQYTGGDSRLCIHGRSARLASNWDLLYRVDNEWINVYTDE